MARVVSDNPLTIDLSSLRCELMHELRAILRTPNKPAEERPLCLLGPLAGHFSSRDPAFYPLHVNTGTLPKPYTVCFIRQIAHPNVILNRRFPTSALPPGDRGLLHGQLVGKLNLE